MDTLAAAFINSENQQQNFLYATIAILTLVIISYRLLRNRAHISVPASLAIALTTAVMSYWLLMLPAPGKGVNITGVTVSSWLNDIRQSDAGAKLASAVPIRLLPVLIIVRAFFGASVLMLGLPFLLMLYKSWFTGIATDAEQATGAAGFKAWFRASNMLWSGTIVVGLWLWAGFPLLAGAVSGAVLLSVYPFRSWINTESGRSISHAGVTAASEHINAQQALVLQMVHEGRISPAEGTRLIAEIAPTSYHLIKPGPYLTLPRKLMLVAAALTLLSVMLPWVRIDFTEEFHQLQKPSNVSQISFAGSHIDNFSAHIIQLNSAIQNMGINREDYSSFLNERGILSVPLHQLGVGWGYFALCVMILCIALVPNEIKTGTRHTLHIAGTLLCASTLIYAMTWGIRYLSLGYYMALISVVIMSAAVLTSITAETGSRDTRSDMAA